MNEYLFEMIKDLPEEEFYEAWRKNKICRKSEEDEEDEILCM